MRATSAIRVTRQTPQGPGCKATTRTSTVCPVCGIPVSDFYPTTRGDLIRRHNRKKDDGTYCLHGRTEKDPSGTTPAF
jgi:hypothetical protein